MKQQDQRLPVIALTVIAMALPVVPAMGRAGRASLEVADHEGAGSDSISPTLTLPKGEIDDVLNLDEVVVTGQGAEIQKRRLSSNVQTLSAKQIEHLPVERLDRMLQTAMPNMKINLASGQPGATSLMWARGLSSAFSNATPVIYVDGVRIDNQNTASALTNDLNGGNHTTGFEGQTSSNSALADIPMENIERIEFVPGGAATTIYGSDAANGVIQIFTRKGGRGRFSASVALEMGSEVANSDFYRFERTRSLLHQRGLVQRYRLRMEGSHERGGWSLGASMSHQEGTIVGDAQAQKRYDIRLGTHHRINRMLEYQASWGAAFHNLRYARNGNEGLYSGLWSIECGDFGYADNTEGLKTLYPLSYRDENGLWQRYFRTANVDELSETDLRLLKELTYKGEALSDHREQIRRFQTSQAFILKPITGLTAKAILGLDYRHNFNKYSLTNEWLRTTGQARYLTQSTMRNFERNYLGLTFDASAQYNLRIGEGLSLVTTAGFQFFSTDDHQSTQMGKGLRDGLLTINGAASRTADEWLSYLYNYGGYIQENIGFRDRYYLDLGLRADNNSTFGEHVGWQYYPKVGLSYLMSEERWLANVSWVNTLRLMTNYGVAGLYPPAYAYQRTVAMSSFLDASAAAFDQYGNNDLGPEKKHSFEAGFSAGLLDRRLTIGLSYYYSLTKDAIFDVPLSPSVGNGSVLKNAGRIENKGIEAQLGVQIVRSRETEVVLQASANTNRNKVLSNGGAATFAIGGFGTSSIQSVVSEGETLGYLRGSRATLQSDGSVRIEKLRNLGSTLPNLYGTIALTARWKQWGLYMSGDYQMGGHVHSYNAQFRFRNGIRDERIPEVLLHGLGMDAEGTNRWKVQKNNWTNLTNYFVYKSDFLKIRQISADYTWKQPFATSGRMDAAIAGRKADAAAGRKALAGKRSGWVESVVFSFAVINPWTITSCPVDPEATVSTSLQQGAVATGGFNYAQYSAPRQFIGSIKVNF